MAFIIFNIPIKASAKLEYVVVENCYKSYSLWSYGLIANEATIYKRRTDYTAKVSYSF